MSAVQSTRPGDIAAALAVEGDIREFVRKEVAPERNGSRSSDDGAMVGAENINVLVKRASTASVEELDNLISDLQRVRDRLKAESERIQDAICRHVRASQATLQSVRLIAGNMERQTEDRPQPPR